MKRSIYGLLAAALLLGVVSLPKAFAAERAKEIQTESREKHAEKWREKSGLSQEQKDKLKAAFKAEREAMKPLRRELRDALQKLKDKVEDEAGDKDIQAALDGVEQAHKAIRAEREKFQASLASIIPAAQRAKMMLRMAGHMAGRMGERNRLEGRMGEHKGFGRGECGGHEQGMRSEWYGSRGGGWDRGSKHEAPEREDEE